MSVTLAYCHTGIVHHPFMESVISFMLKDGKERREVVGNGRIISTQSAYIADARNTIVKEFLAQDHDWLWFLDYDMDFSSDILYKLLDAADPVERPIMAGLYFTFLHKSIHPIFFEKADDDSFRPITEFTTNQIMPIASSGMGCTLIHRRVLEAMRDAYPGPWHWFGHDQVGDSVCGEDITFARRCEKLGFPFYGHTGVILDHLKTRRVGLMDYANTDKILVTEGER